MILNAGAGGGAGSVRIIDAGKITVAAGSTITLPEKASLVLVGEYSSGPSNPSSKSAVLLAPGCSTSGMSPETTFKADGVTVQFGTLGLGSTITRTYIAFA